jgi:hypothetical protein
MDSDGNLDLIVASWHPDDFIEKICDNLRFGDRLPVWRAEEEPHEGGGGGSHFSSHDLRLVLEIGQCRKSNGWKSVDLIPAA